VISDARDGIASSYSFNFQQQPHRLPEAEDFVLELTVHLFARS